jgi:SAM-dependent methyltransferase
MILVIGPGISGVGDKMVDLYPYPGVTDVADIAVEPLPYEDNTFDEVRASHVLEHVETVLHWREDGKWYRRFPRVEIMREIYRVLKSGGVAIISVPVGYPNYAQDPTHADVPWTHATFGYFCNQWGGGDERHEAHFSSGIDFGFVWVRDEFSEDRKNLTVWLGKP